MFRSGSLATPPKVQVDGLEVEGLAQEKNVKS